MRFIPLALVAGALVCSSFVTVPQTTDGAKPTLTKGEQLSVDEKLASMQGLWRLTDLKTLRADPSRRAEVGYLLVSGLCFSLELHWGWAGQDNVHFVNKDFQSGMHRFELDDAGNLEAKSLIGSFFNREGLLQWEEPGKERRYRVEQIGEVMKWSNEEGTTFTFEHVPQPRAARRDVFGRPIPEKPKADKNKPGDAPPK